MLGLHLRPGTEDDALRLVALQGEGFGGWTVVSFRNELALGWSRTLVLEGRDVSVPQPVTLGGMVYWIVADEIQLLNIAIDVAYRRRGLALYMLNALITRARNDAIVRITLEVRRDNIGALALYRGLDFRAVGVRPKYYADTGADAILMERDV